MNQFKTDEDRRLAEHNLRRAVHKLQRAWLDGNETTMEQIAVIEACEYLHGTMEDNKED